MKQCLNQVREAYLHINEEGFWYFKNFTDTAFWYRWSLICAILLSSNFPGLPPISLAAPSQSPDCSPPSSVSIHTRVIHSLALFSHSYLI